jgi:hypothetical protein
MTDCRLGIVAAVALALVVGAGDVSHAQGTPAPIGWALLGQVTLDKNGCVSCPAIFRTPNRLRAFGLASDSPFPISLSGRIDVTCTDGATYNLVLSSPARGGLFQIVPNSCVNLESKEIRLSTTSVSLSPPDAERAVVLSMFGRLR